MLFWLLYKMEDAAMWCFLRTIQVWDFVIGRPGYHLFPDVSWLTNKLPKLPKRKVKPYLCKCHNENWDDCPKVILQHEDSMNRFVRKDSPIYLDYQAPPLDSRCDATGRQISKILGSPGDLFS